jgi:hypothetical protein
MKNLLKDKKVLVGGGLVLGALILAHLHKKGLKVLAKQSPTSQSGADGTITSSGFTVNTDPKLSNLQNALAQLQLAQSNATTQGQSSLQIMPKPNLMPIINATNVFGTPASPKIIASNTGVANPIIIPTQLSQMPILISPSGIAVTNAGTLQPIGVSGWLTTIQTGITGVIPKKTVAELSTQIEKVTTKK